MTASPNQTDAQLLGRMLAGDEEAFVTLYRRRQGGVYRFALQMCGSAAVAEDVTQEVFIVLMRDGRNFDPSRGSLAAFLYGVARNHVLRVFDRERALVQFDGDDPESDHAPHESLVAHDDPLGDLTRGETVERVRQAVLALPPHYREAVVLCDLHEVSYAEAAGALGVAVGTVRSRLHRGRAMLVEKLRGLARQETEAQAGLAAADESGQGQTALRTARCFA
jgi:RNA polymerase sigma-70 factor, ECF subfamily